MSSPAFLKWRGPFVLGLFILAMAILLAHWYVKTTHRHVGVEISNVDDIARVDIDCRRALVLSGEGSKYADLGWLAPGDRIYLSDYNKRGAAAWTYTLTIDGVEHTFSSGHAGVTGRVAESYSTAFALLVTANGAQIGSIGCDPPSLVSSSVKNYQQSPDAAAVSKQKEAAPLWHPSRFPFALIEDLTDLMPVFAAAGWIAAISTACVRRRITNPRLIGAVATAFGLFVALTHSYGLQVLVAWLVVIGLGLLLVSAIALWPHTGPQCPTDSSTPAPKPNPE